MGLCACLRFCFRFSPASGLVWSAGLLCSRPVSLSGHLSVAEKHSCERVSERVGRVNPRLLLSVFRRLEATPSKVQQLQLLWSASLGLSWNLVHCTHPARAASHSTPAATSGEWCGGRGGQGRHGVRKKAGAFQA